MSEKRYTMLLDEHAEQTIDRLVAAYGLRTRAAAYELSVRVMTWLTEQRLHGYEVGRFKLDTFQPLLLPMDPIEPATEPEALP